MSSVIGRRAPHRRRERAAANPTALSAPCMGGHREVTRVAKVPDPRGVEPELLDCPPCDERELLPQARRVRVDLEQPSSCALAPRVALLLLRVLHPQAVGGNGMVTTRWKLSYRRSGELGALLGH